MTFYVLILASLFLVCFCLSLPSLSVCMLWDARKPNHPHTALRTWYSTSLWMTKYCRPRFHEITENYHGSNTVFLVGMLMSVVGGVFVVFALMALCYRSVVVHKNFSLCLRLVCRYIHVEVLSMSSLYFRLFHCHFVTSFYLFFLFFLVFFSFPFISTPFYSCVSPFVFFVPIHIRVYLKQKKYIYISPLIGLVP